MAMKLYERYPGRFSPATSAYPQGAFKNRSAPGAKDGSYLEKDWANDKEGFFGSLLRAAGITPNGDPDTALASQYFDAMKSLGLQQATESLTGVSRRSTIAMALDGTDDSTAMSPLKVNTAIDNKAIGFGQTLQNVTASREKGTTYTNNTNRAIQVMINFDPDGSLSVLRLSGESFNIPDNQSEFIFAIIPVGGTYSLSAWGVANPIKWVELR